MSTRPASHAGTWYSADPAWAYACMDPSTIRTVLVLGPSHVSFLRGCALTQYASVDTPLGPIEVNAQLNEELRQSSLFQMMEHDLDIREHSLEMHYPYIRKVWDSHPVTIVPILVGDMSAFTRQKIAQYLAKYAADPSVGIVVSSDFCHWGERFRYTRYQASHDAAPQVLTSRSPSSAYAACPIHKSIEALDIDAMARISFDKGGVWHAHDRFKSYIMTTRNTICGQHPILLLLLMLYELEKQAK
ncbi:hypothetical protein Malapachy_3049 [Malassezia pachydermatis]|uniref:Uncharacterized protein n=1 Tax=Malassezia pachydermatis TaxID=77020 RepID=A0A0M9VQW8_9BASI|nr:hypothetical protein Malapachy_3049 [Malassezia pachydermatis]KOS15985.1 hypothetical protein Malapachy_3049 [Malassezia pachydermatis]